MKTHRFVVTVKTDSTKTAAKTAILSAFAKRQPDGCKFRVTAFRKIKPEVRTVYVDPHYIA